MGRLELPASCSQSKRATNCATPGYRIFQLWSNMWSTPIFDQLPARGKVLSAQVFQGFPGFLRAVARTWASRSQSRRATNCATPRYKIVELPGRFLPKQARYQLRYTRIWNCFICGLSCGLGRFLTSDFAEMLPASGSVPAGCGVGLFPSWMGGICSQTLRVVRRSLSFFGSLQ